jgi:MoxR-like ATPase
VGELEVQHLIRVITECSLLLHDVYSERRIASIMHPQRRLPSRVIERLLEHQRGTRPSVHERIRRLPFDVRMVGDKALFDLGLLGLRRVKGFDLEELGSRAYRLAGQVLMLLAEDERLRVFFKHNRLLMLPLEQEVDFLRQCADRFPVYARILHRANHPPEEGLRERLGELQARVPLMAAVADALAEDDRARGPQGPDADDLAADAARAPEDVLAAYERIVAFSSLDLARLRDALRAVVVDQDEAVDVLCDELALFAAGTRDPRKPPAYLLIGPTGVGKNHLVESLRGLLEGLWHQEVPMLTIEGPNYTYPSDINELRGATRGFIRSDEDGLLSTFHDRSSSAPLALILIDEVEKAHPQLRRFFLSILDRGTTTDNRGRVLAFTHSIVFFTSNLGYTDAQRRSAPIGYLEQAERLAAVDHEIRRSVHRALSPEFLNRVRVIHFGRLTRASAERILDLELGRIARRYRELHGLDLVLEPAAREELIRRGFSPQFGARHLAATLESVCNVEVAKRIRRDHHHAGPELEELVRWLREVRAGRRAFDAEATRRRVLETAKARLGYDAMRIDFRDGRFEYAPLGREADR